MSGRCSAALVASLTLACGGAHDAGDGVVNLGAWDLAQAGEVPISTVRLRLYGANANTWPGVEVAALRAPSGAFGARVDKVPAGDVAFHAVALDARNVVLYESASPDPVRRVVAGATLDLGLVLQQRKGAAAPFVDGAPFVATVDVSQTQLAAGGVAHLAATYGDLDGLADVASARWSGPGTFGAPGAAETDWTAPSTDGDYVLRFTVTDRKGQAASVDVTLHVDRRFARGAAAVDIAFNASPVVQRIDVRDVKVPGGAPGAELIDLAAVATDADGDLLRYAWAEANGCGAFVGAVDAAATRFAARPGGVDCRFVVTVRDHAAADPARARGGVDTGTVRVGMTPPVLAVAPSFEILGAQPVPATPGSAASLQIVPADRASHLPGAPAAWDVSWSDGGAGGALLVHDTPYALAGAATYVVPAACPAPNTGATWTIGVRASVADVASGVSAARTFDLLVECP